MTQLGKQVLVESLAWEYVNAMSQSKLIQFAKLNIEAKLEAESAESLLALKKAIVKAKNVANNCSDIR